METSARRNDVTACACELAGCMCVVCVGACGCVCVHVWCVCMCMRACGVCVCVCACACVCGVCVLHVQPSTVLHVCRGACCVGVRGQLWYDGTVPHRDGRGTGGHTVYIRRAVSPLQPCWEQGDVETSTQSHKHAPTHTNTRNHPHKNVRAAQR